MRKFTLLFILAMLISGCVSMDLLAIRRLSFVNYATYAYLPKAKDYPVDLFFEGKPAKEYKVIGEVMGFADDGNQVRSLLEVRIRQLGADGAIDITTKAGTRKDTEIVDVRETNSKGHARDYPVAKTNYYDIINITAKVIKYKE